MTAMHRWTAADDATIHRMTAAGHKLQEIVDAIGCSYSQAKDRRRVLGAVTKTRQPRSKFDRDAALRLHAEGYTDSAISQIVGAHKTTIAEFLRLRGLPPHKPTHKPLAKMPDTSGVVSAARAGYAAGDAALITRFQRDFREIERLAARGELTPLQRRELLEQARDLSGISSLRIKAGEPPIGTGRTRDTYPRYGA